MSRSRFQSVPGVCRGDQTSFGVPFNSSPTAPLCWSAVASMSSMLSNHPTAWAGPQLSPAATDLPPLSSMKHT